LFAFPGNGLSGVARARYTIAPDLDRSDIDPAPEVDDPAAGQFFVPGQTDLTRDMGHLLYALV